MTISTYLGPAGGDVAFARQVARGRISVPFSGNLNANLEADADLGIAIPQYVFATPVLGGQAAVALLVPFGRNTVSVNATLTGALGPIGFTVSGARTDSVSGFADLIPQFSLRWNHGVHNFMTYITGDIPVGAYDPTRLANLGIGHGAIDAGGGYTYFIRQPGANSRPCSVSPTIWKIRPRNTKTALTCTWTGAPRSS